MSNAHLQRASDRFRATFGRSPRFAALAPGRVNLIGEHTDYNDGFVLPMAIERQTVIVADRVAGRDACVVSTDDDQPARFSVEAGLRAGEPAWGNYVRGVVAGGMTRGLDPGGFNAFIDSTVPLGGGLSSSAALEVAVATLIEAMTARSLDPVDKALLCQRAEHEFAGVPCGIMDQFTSVLAEAGHAMLLDCRSRETKRVPLSDPEITVLIANSNVRHELASGQYAVRRRQCEQAVESLGVTSLRDVTLDQLNASAASMDATVYRRARHVVTENQRTQSAVDALIAGDWPRVGALMFESHASLRDDYEVSCDELDLLVDVARTYAPDRGVFGSRMTGGGFGGCTVSLVRRDVADEVAESIHHRYHQQTGIEPSTFFTQPAAGAQIVSVSF